MCGEGELFVREQHCVAAAAMWSLALVVPTKIKNPSVHPASIKPIPEITSDLFFSFHVM